MTGRGFAVLLLCFALVRASLADSDNSTVVDCHPENNANVDECQSRGCNWAETDVPGAPYCTFPAGYGYDVLGSPLPTEWGFVSYLRRKEGQQPTVYGNDIVDAYLSVEYWSENILRLKIFDPNNERHQVPIELNTPSAPAVNLNYQVTLTDSPQFGVVVTRNSTNTAIFNTNVPGFVFSDQFLQITARLSSPNIYGFGEQRHKSYGHDVNWKTWSAFARDTTPDSDSNVYGVQPFYMNLENDGNANGVFLLNSNAMEITLQPSPAITFRTIGGILDFFVFLGPTPESVVEQYTSVVGRPLMPPYWGLGFQLSRWGYENTSAVRAVVERQRAAGIPQDVQYSDIDYMDNYRDFSLSKTDFVDLPHLIEDIHQHGQRYVVILDAGVADDPNDYAYQEGIKDDIFVKFENGTILEGHVWPGLAVYPDFSKDDTQNYWSRMCRHLFENQSVKYDGLWTDMNEPSNFDVGSIYGCERNKYNYPPYAPHILGAEDDGKLFDKTICMDAVHQAGRHYDVHSLSGYFMNKRTFTALQEVFPSRRPVIVTRSQYAGSGRYASHWLGDNASTWQAIKDAIIGILEYNIFGMPFVGADICGFIGTTTVELCTRWMQVGAFYPFSRNHNTLGSPEQDPAILGDQVINASIRALTERYRLLPYLYTLLQNAHDRGSTVARPLLHEFPKDPNTWNISTQFLWGSSLLISPVLDEGQVEVNAYFPEARWFDYYTGAEETTVGTTVTLSAPLDGNIPLHVRGGSILPTQEPSLTTAASRNNSFQLLVALNENSEASGSLYWDDGVSPGTRTTGHFNQLYFSAKPVSNEAMVIHIITLNNRLGNMTNELDAIKVYGLSREPSNVTVDLVALDPSNIAYDSSTKVLQLTGLNLEMPQSHGIILA